MSSEVAKLCAYIRREERALDDDRHERTPGGFLVDPKNAGREDVLMEIREEMQDLGIWVEP